MSEFSMYFDNRIRQEHHIYRNICLNWKLQSIFVTIFDSEGIICVKVFALLS